MRYFCVCNNIDWHTLKAFTLEPPTVPVIIGQIFRSINDEFCELLQKEIIIQIIQKLKSTVIYPTREKRRANCHMEEIKIIKSN